MVDIHYARFTVNENVDCSLCINQVYLTEWTAHDKYWLRYLTWSLHIAHSVCIVVKWKTSLRTHEIPFCLLSRYSIVLDTLHVGSFLYKLRILGTFISTLLHLISYCSSMIYLLILFALFIVYYGRPIAEKWKIVRFDFIFWFEFQVRVRDGGLLITYPILYPSLHC